MKAKSLWCQISFIKLNSMAKLEFLHLRSNFWFYECSHAYTTTTGPNQICSKTYAKSNTLMHMALCLFIKVFLFLQGPRILFHFKIKLSQLCDQIRSNIFSQFKLEHFLAWTQHLFFSGHIRHILTFSISY